MASPRVPRESCPKPAHGPCPAAGATGPTAPIGATIRAKMPDKLMSFPVDRAHTIRRSDAKARQKRIVDVRLRRSWLRCGAEDIPC